MVFIITGTAESDRGTVGRLLADDLGWEFVDAKSLHPPASLAAQNCNSSSADANPFLRIETLSAAVNSWITKWQDVVVSCPMLTETDRKQLSEMSSLVKIVCLEESHATDRTAMLGRERVMGSELPDGWHANREPEQEVLTVDLSRQGEEIIREMISALVLNRRSAQAKTV